MTGYNFSPANTCCIRSNNILV